MLASRSGSILVGYSAGSTGKGYSAGCSARSTGELLWDTQRDARRDPLRAALVGATVAGYSARSTGEPLWRDGFTGEQLWRDTGRDPLASCSGEILGGIHWRAALAGYSADALASCSGGILGGIHWRAALAGYWVGAWCKSIANADSNIKSSNPFLPGGGPTNKFLCFGQSPPSTLTSLHRVNSSMVFEWLGAYGFALRALSTCLCVKLHLSASYS